MFKSRMLVKIRLAQSLGKMAGTQSRRCQHDRSEIKYTIQLFTRDREGAARTQVRHLHEDIGISQTMSLVSNQDVVVEEENPEVTLAQILNVSNFVEKYLDIDEISYEIFEKKLRVKYWDKEKWISTNNEEDQTKIIQRDLMSILCNEKLRIDTLKIEDYQEDYFITSLVGMRALQNTLNQLPNKLKVLNLDYYVEEDERECFIAALKTIDLEHLKSLQLRFGHAGYKWAPIFKDLYDLEEWKRVKSLKVEGGLSLSETISNYTHFENAQLEIFRRRDGTDKQVSKQYNTNNTPFPCWVSIPYPDSDKKLEMLVENRNIWFKGPCYVEEEGEEERTMLRKEKTMSLIVNQDVVVEEEKPKLTLTQILNVPDFVEKYLDIDMRLCLRATCTTIREIINEKQLDMDCLTYKCNQNIIEISTNRDFKISYKIIGGGLRVKYWDKEKVINTDDEVDQIEMPLVFNQDVVVEEEKPKVTLTQILNVPDFVENHLDIDTRLCLRATCTTIRKIINEKLLDIDCLIYKCNQNIIEISTNRDFKISYKIIGGGLRVKYWDKEKVINTDDEVDQIEIIQRDFMSIFGQGKMKIETLRIEDRPGNGFFRHSEIGKRALLRTFNELFNKLKVRNLEYSADDWDFALVVALRTIDPEHLKILQIDIESLEDDIYYIDRSLFHLEEWKRCLCYASDVPVHAVVMKLKDQILLNPTLKQMKIRMNWKITDRDFEYIKASLQQYNTDNAPFPCWVSIPYPDSEKKLELLVEKKMIWFKGPCYVEGEEEEDEEDSSDEEERDEEEDDEEDEVGEDAEEGDEEEELDEDEILPLNALNLNDS
ncbi:hypothetical protein GCK72_011397 [Caenorhabditis remanei]|uniref:DUF38 domain-containing protein n=1 Tax=Caenorhabditis remanei TaxID=31234 RepID=A0A6A5H8E2_CAERE|nr:hypothetical protein GCK72_011397 [Caenorhabditis remanei]KAF1763131.1 hypothetical protein GCK72_011397 [Caenorhabditis remanei]